MVKAIVGLNKLCTELPPHHLSQPTTFGTQKPPLARVFKCEKKTRQSFICREVETGICHAYIRVCDLKMLHLGRFGSMAVLMLRKQEIS